MIEFKAECGHTVRAKNQDAGQMVRCSYCGKASEVPKDQEDSLDFLLNDMESATVSNTTTEKRSRKSRKKKIKNVTTPATNEGIDPFSVALKLGYAAACIIVLVIVSKWFVLPLINNDINKNRPARESAAADSNLPTINISSKPGGNNTTTAKTTSGLYVHTTPPGGKVCFIPSEVAPSPGQRFSHFPDALHMTPGQTTAEVDTGSYLVEVSFLWSDPSLKKYPDYKKFRKQIYSGTDGQRRATLREYFIPDAGREFFVDEVDGRIFLVKQYQVQVRSDRAGVVRSLFLPRVSAGEDADHFSIERLIGYLPMTKSYQFDESHVRSELEFYGVPARDRQYVMDALAAIGEIPYKNNEGVTFIFTIGLDSNEFGAVEIR